MRHFATESGKSKGQFYTPAEVSRVMAQVLGIRTAPVDVTLDAFDTTGLTNVEMQLESLSPTTSVPTTWIGLKDPHFHWQWSAHAGVEGTYRATFGADPSRHVYAIAYFAVSSPGGTADAGPIVDSGTGHDASPADASNRVAPRRRRSRNGSFRSSSSAPPCYWWRAESDSLHR